MESIEVAPAAAAKIKTTGSHWPSFNPFRIFFSGGIWSDIRSDFALKSSYDNKEVEKQVKWWQHHPQALEKYFRNSCPYIYYVYQETRRRDLPSELALLPILESGYDPLDYSYAGANGIWQLMPGTASGLNIKINWWYDGRRDLIASTNAAFKYLTYLHAYFNNDWLLALAAYNAGEGAVQAAINRNARHGYPTNFWSLSLSHETTLYVPRILALAVILKDPKRYGISLPEVENRPYFKIVDTGSQIDLHQAAQLADISFATMAKLNSAFRRVATDPNGPYTLLLPANKATLFSERLASLPDNQRITWQEHTVQNAETILSLAKRFHISSALLRRANDLKNLKLRPGQTILVPLHYNDDEANDVPIVKKAIREEVLPGPQRWVHTVQPGETLKSIAAKYHIVPPAEILYWNHLSAKESIVTDQKLLVWLSPAMFKALHEPPPPQQIKYYFHKVKRGDTIYSLAHRFKTTPEKLKQVNMLYGKRTLKVGQMIKVPQLTATKNSIVITKHRKKQKIKKNIPKYQHRHKALLHSSKTKF